MNKGATFMDSLGNLLPASGGALAGILLTLVAGAYLLTRNSFWWTDMSYRLPVIGKLARYSQDYSETRRGEWLNVEAALCRDYARHVVCLSKQQFENDREYLRKAFDHGRRPMPGWVLLVLGLLIAAEGFGFSYVLSGLMALDSSENLRFYLTWAIVFVLATILVWVTHKAGHQLYRTRLLRSCFRQYQAHAIVDQGAGERKKVFSSHVVSLADPQTIDDAQPPHVQCANRVVTHPGDRGNYVWLWIAGALVAVIAIGSVSLRVDTLHAMALEGTATAAEETAALTGFFLLATIFVVTQLVSIGVGYTYGFGGRQSKEAYRETQGRADYEAYFRPTRQTMSIADLRLTQLHRKMEHCLPQEIEWDRSFYTFVHEERQRGATDLQDLSDLDNILPRESTSQPKGAPNFGVVDGGQRVAGDERTGA